MLAIFIGFAFFFWNFVQAKKEEIRHLEQTNNLMRMVGSMRAPPPQEAPAQPVGGPAEGYGGGGGGYGGGGGGGYGGGGGDNAGVTEHPLAGSTGLGPGQLLGNAVTIPRTGDAGQLGQRPQVAPEYGPVAAFEQSQYAGSIGSGMSSTVGTHLEQHTPMDPTQALPGYGGGIAGTDDRGQPLPTYP